MDGEATGRGGTPTILVTDDEPDVVDLVRYNLVLEGYDVDVAYDGIEAIKKVEEIVPDLLVLDVMMPRLDGFAVCRYVKSNDLYRNIPVLILTARDSEDDEVRALDNGADDYLRKPVSPKRLLSHVRALLRRTSPDGQNVVSLRNFVIDRDRFVVFTLDGERIHLPRKEFELLYKLAQHPGRVFSREQLLDTVWGSDVYVELRTVDVHVGRLRKALRQGGGDDPIRTVRSAGYALRAD